jgi:hypothetical protein
MYYNRYVVLGNMEQFFTAVVGRLEALEESNSRFQEATLAKLSSLSKRSPPRTTGSSVISSLTASINGNHQASAVAGEKTPSPTSSNDSKRVSFQDNLPSIIESVAKDIAIEGNNEAVADDIAFEGNIVFEEINEDIAEISSTIAVLNFVLDESSVETGESSDFTMGSG